LPFFYEARIIDSCLGKKTSPLVFYQYTIGEKGLMLSVVWVLLLLPKPQFLDCFSDIAFNLFNCINQSRL